MNDAEALRRWFDQTWIQIFRLPSGQFGWRDNVTFTVGVVPTFADLEAVLATVTERREALRQEVRAAYAHQTYAAKPKAKLSTEELDDLLKELNL